MAAHYHPHHHHQHEGTHLSAKQLLFQKRHEQVNNIQFFFVFLSCSSSSSSSLSPLWRLPATSFSRAITATTSSLLTFSREAQAEAASAASPDPRPTAVAHMAAALLLAADDPLVPPTVAVWPWEAVVWPWEVPRTSNWWR